MNKRLTRRDAIAAGIVSASAASASGANNMQSDESSRIGCMHMRVVRPTDNLSAVIKFYREGLGFEVLYEFTGRNGFDGVMLGCQGAGYHLTFTHKAGHKAGRAPTKENLLVFYLPDRAVWELAVARMKNLGHEPVKPFNPYWENNGRTFEDPDGYRIVLEQDDWNG